MNRQSIFASRLWALFVAACLAAACGDGSTQGGGAVSGDPFFEKGADEFASRIARWVQDVRGESAGDLPLEFKFLSADGGAIDLPCGLDGVDSSLCELIRNEAALTGKNIEGFLTELLELETDDPAGIDAILFLIEQFGLAPFETFADERPDYDRELQGGGSSGAGFGIFCDGVELVSGGGGGGGGATVSGPAFSFSAGGGGGGGSSTSSECLADGGETPDKIGGSANGSVQGDGSPAGGMPLPDGDNTPRCYVQNMESVRRMIAECPRDRLELIGGGGGGAGARIGGDAQSLATGYAFTFSIGTSLEPGGDPNDSGRGAKASAASSAMAQCYAEVGTLCPSFNWAECTCPKLKQCWADKLGSDVPKWATLASCKSPA